VRTPFEHFGPAERTIACRILQIKDEDIQPCARCPFILLAQVFDEPAKCDD